MDTKIYNLIDSIDFFKVEQKNLLKNIYKNYENKILEKEAISFLNDSFGKKSLKNIKSLNLEIIEITINGLKNYCIELPLDKFTVEQYYKLGLALEEANLNIL